MPSITDAGRGGTRMASPRQGARARAAPKPPASSAMRKPIMAASHSDGIATELLLASATAPVNSAYGRAIDSAAGATCGRLSTWPSWVIHRPARSISAAGQQHQAERAAGRSGPPRAP